jgi:hypothetical protein
MYGGGCREEETKLVFAFRQQYIETVKSELIDVCNGKLQEHEVNGYRFANRPQALVNASSVNSFRTVADMRALMPA